MLINPSQKWDLKSGVLALSEKLVSREVDIRPLIGAPFFTSGSIIFAGVDGKLAEDNANLFWDNVNKRLGIKTKTPSTTLDVNGGISATDAKLSSLTSGSILFAGSGGLISQDNANLFWDNVNKRLGIKTKTPSTTLDVAGIIKGQYGGGITAGGVGVTKYFKVGSLPYTGTGTFEKLYVQVWGGGALGWRWYLSGIDEYIISSRDAKVIYRQRKLGETGNYQLLVYDTGSGYDFFVAVVNQDYPNILIRSFRLQSEDAWVEQKIVEATPSGTDDTSNWTVYTTIATDKYGNVGIRTATPEFNLDVRGNSCVNRIANADSTNTLRNSFNLVLRGAYWSGSASVNRDAAVFHRMLSTTPTSEIVFQIAGVDMATVRDSIADGETALLLRRNVGGTYSLVRVSMGPPDSGGTGYRVLRVPN
ncbi:MAG: hypothetical protein QXI11_01975 [Thermoproteota archaeon]